MHFKILFIFPVRFAQDVASLCAPKINAKKLHSSFGPSRKFQHFFHKVPFSGFGNYGHILILFVWLYGKQVLKP